MSETSQQLPDTWYSREDAADHYKRSVRWVIESEKQGLLKTVRLGRNVLISGESIRALDELLRTAGEVNDEG